MTHKNKTLVIISVVFLVLAGAYVAFNGLPETPLDATPQDVTLSGTYVCLLYINPSEDNTGGCKFGLKTDDGIYYAVNFGQSAGAMELFQNGARITAQGFVVIKEALSTDEWAKYNIKGIFTITQMIDPVPTSSGKLNINVVCEGALAYMTFPDAQSADTFVAECKEGKHPEVIEQYKKQMGLGDGATI